MTPKLAYLPLYVRDFLSDLKVLSLDFDQQAIHLRLLMASWELGPLPQDLEILARMTGWPRDEEQILVVLRTCWVDGPVGWTSARLEKERAYAHSIVKANAERTAAATEARRQRDVHRDVHRDVQRNVVQPQAQDQVQEQEEKREEPRDGARLSPRRPRKEPNPVNIAFGEWWETRWEEIRGEAWKWSAKERVAVDRIRSLAGGSLEAMQARAENLLTLGASDAFLAQNASCSLLGARWNQLGSVVVKTPRIPLSNSERFLVDVARKMEETNGHVA